LGFAVLSRPTTHADHFFAVSLAHPTTTPSARARPSGRKSQRGPDGVSCDGYHCDRADGALDTGAPHRPARPSGKEPIMSDKILHATDPAAFNAALDDAGRPWRLKPGEPHGWILIQLQEEGTADVLDLRDVHSDFEAVRCAVAFLLDKKRL
jgi:hypothetical protein